MLKSDIYLHTRQRKGVVGSVVLLAHLIEINNSEMFQLVEETFNNVYVNSWQSVLMVYRKKKYFSFRKSAGLLTKN